MCVYVCVCVLISSGTQRLSVFIMWACSRTAESYTVFTAFARENLPTKQMPSWMTGSAVDAVSSKPCGRCWRPASIMHPRPGHQATGPTDWKCSKKKIENKMNISSLRLKLVVYSYELVTALWPFQYLNQKSDWNKPWYRQQRGLHLSNSPRPGASCFRSSSCRLLRASACLLSWQRCSPNSDVSLRHQRRRATIIVPTNSDLLFAQAATSSFLSETLKTVQNFNVLYQKSN